MTDGSPSGAGDDAGPDDRTDTGEAGDAAAEGDETAISAAEEESPEPTTEESTAEDQPGEPTSDDAGSDVGAGADQAAVEQGTQQVSDLPPDVQKYDRFKKINGGTYDRANEFLRDRTYITAREWAIARLCADFRTETGVEMTKIGENLPELVPFMTDTYTPQAVNQARASFEEKVRKAGATFLYGAMCDFFTAEELDDVMYEATEVAKFLLEVEGVELSVEEELAAEDEISDVMRTVREHSAALRHDHVECPDCGHHFEAIAEDAVDED